jgi:hypothetical protein
VSGDLENGHGTLLCDRMHALCTYLLRVRLMLFGIGRHKGTGR